MMTLKTDIIQNKKLKHRKVRLVLPYPITHNFKVKNEFKGKTLLTMMSIRFPFRSSIDWNKKIENGFVGLNGETVTANTILKTSDIVFHHNPNVIEPSVPDEIIILKESDNWIAVYKPAPLPMHPGGRYNKNTLTSILEEMGYTDLKIIHRLDAVTSGIVVFAKNKEFAKQAMLAFSSGNVSKKYYAEVAGIPTENSISINSPIKRKNGFVFESDVSLKQAKSALTHFKVLLKKEKSSIIECVPITGRTHQIRLHLEKWGYPIIDDPIYGINGDKSSKKAQNSGIKLVNAELNIPTLDIALKLDQFDISINWMS